MKRYQEILSTCLTVGALVTSASGIAGDYSVDGVNDAVIPLDVASYPSGVIHFTAGQGSGGTRLASDPAGIVYTVADRGANVACKDDVDLLGAEICSGTGRIFPLPGFSPAIYKYQQDDSSSHGWTLLDVIQLKDSNGIPVTGIPNPLTLTDTEEAFDKNGNSIALDPNGLDPEGIIKLADGTFWLAEEYASSIFHVSATGEVLERLVPTGLEPDYTAATYPISGALPALIASRKLNRGIEAVGISPDEVYLYFMTQSPLAHPDGNAYKTSRVIRIYKMDRVSKIVVGEYAYLEDLPETFADDSATAQKAVKISEMVATGQDELVILERVELTTKLYRVQLSSGTNIWGSTWDNPATSPTLEQLTSLPASITPVTKVLELDSPTDLPGVFPVKVESIILLDDKHILFTNDNDFGFDGSLTKLIRVEAEDFLGAGH